MNICSYAVSISKKPKQYVIALNPNSKTYDNFCKDGEGVLQILSKDCKKYVSPFERNSGKNVNKLEKYKKDTLDYRNFPVLKSAIAVIKVKMIKQVALLESDHDIFVVEVLHWKYLNPEAEFLYRGDISKKK
jgi:flavin reductase (DIM6/NTAB) family NADH-FMN oxidoreductase RutF